MVVPMGRRKVPRKWIVLRTYLTMKGQEFDRRRLISQCDGVTSNIANFMIIGDQTMCI